MASSDFPHVPASSHRGQSSKVQFYVNPELRKQLQILFESRRFPFDTISDMWRLAVYRLAIWLDDLEDVPGTNISLMISMSEFIAAEMERIKYEEVVEAARRLVNQHMDGGRPNDAMKAARYVSQYVERMEEGELRDKFRLMIRGFNLPPGPIEMLPPNPNGAWDPPALSAFDPANMTEEE